MSPVVRDSLKGTPPEHSPRRLAGAWAWYLARAPRLAATMATLLGVAILAEASLSFLGLGTQPPDPSWGTMVNTGQRLIELSPWPVVFPGLAIIVAVLGFNLLGDGIRDAFDPRLAA